MDSFTLDYLDLHMYLLAHTKWAIKATTSGYTALLGEIIDKYLVSFPSKECSIWSESGDLIADLVKDAAQSKLLNEQFLVISSWYFSRSLTA